MNFNSKNGLPSETLAYYIAERAKGGTGLVEFSLIIPSPEPWLTPLNNSCIRGYDPHVVPGYRRIARMAHRYGTKVFGEVATWGHWSGGMAPSYLPAVSTHGTPRELEVHEIEELVEYYGKTAGYMKRGGLDGVDLHATHGFILEQFLSPLFNRRTDKYGGPLANRMRFMVEVIDCVREEIGADMALGMRLIGDELIPGGITLDESTEVARRLDRMGKIDFLNMDLGIEPQQVHIAIAPMYKEPGYQVYVAEAIKKAVKRIKVGICGRIHEPRLAEQVLAERKADFIGMTRALIADPELPRKVREGRLEDVRTCISGLEDCLANLFNALPIQCTVNPVVGREKELGSSTIKRARRRKRVLVVGAGPAGLETARVAALRGHAVTLYEQAAEIGGRIHHQAKLPGRAIVGTMVAWYRRQLEQLGVHVELAREVDANFLRRQPADAIVLATGSLPVRNGLQSFNFAPIPGADQPNVLTFDEALDQQKPIGRRVLILDDIGFIEGCGLAELLASQGKEVEVVSRLPYVGMELVANQQIYYVYERLHKQGVQLTPQTFIRAIQGRSVRLFNVFTNDETVRENVDTVVLITGRVQNDSLYRQLRGKVEALYRVGDCALYSMKMGDAVRDGHHVGRLL